MPKYRYSAKRIKNVKKYVSKAFESLPDWMKKYFPSKDVAVKQTAYNIRHGLNYDSQGRWVSARQILEASIKTQARHAHELTIRDMYRRFRIEESAVYSRYNSYVYRRGYSSSTYFYENATYSRHGSIVTLITELPEGPLNALEIVYDYSSQEFYAKMY